MATNPLLGSRISLISKNNIRYEGTLYSINEADSQVALQNVKSYGTEGRELLDTTGTSTYVPPNDMVHAYLLFRGQDIKDLHVHEKMTSDVPPPTATDTTTAEVAATTQTSSTPAATMIVQGESKSSDAKITEDSKQVVSDNLEEADKTKGATVKKDAPPKATRNSAGTSDSSKKSGGVNKEPKKVHSTNGGVDRKNQNMVGSGASLLNRKARGAKGSQDLAVEEGEFDFESNLAEFDKVTIEPTGDGGGDDAVDPYSKDDFFDTISSEATDRINGIDNRLRGAAERNLNLDTFGAVSLGNNHGRRNYYGGRGGGGRDGNYGGGRGGRGGRGRGRGRGYNNNHSNRHDQGGSGPAPRQNNRWKESAST